MKLNLFLGLFFLLAIATCQNPFGCSLALNMENGCAKESHFEMMYHTKDANAAESAAILQLKFYDKDGNILGNFPLRYFMCSGLQRGKTDMVQICAEWMPLVRKVTLLNPSSDGTLF